MVNTIKPTLTGGCNVVVDISRRVVDVVVVVVLLRVVVVGVGVGVGAPRGADTDETIESRGALIRGKCRSPLYYESCDAGSGVQ